jgi:hypothetical protein
VVSLGPAADGSLYVTIAGVDASIRAPQPVLSVVARVLAYASNPIISASIPVAIEVESDGFLWRITGKSDRSFRVLSATSALPQVGGAVIASLVSDVAHTAQLSVWRASVLERDGHAVAFVGDDWESCIVLAAHLHVRGWRLLGGDRALVDPGSLTVFALRKLLYVTLSFLDELPLAYRRAVEGSPWYSTPHDIAFYAVDPALAHPAAPWAETGRLQAVLKVDGQASEVPSLERADPFTLDCGMRTVDLERAGVAVAEVRLGDYIETCSLLERWLSALPSA